MTENDQILECRDGPAAAKPPLEWWDAADRYFMDCLKAHAIAFPENDIPPATAHIVTKQPRPCSPGAPCIETAPKT